MPSWRANRGVVMKSARCLPAIVALLLLLMMALAPSAFAGQVTHVMYALENPTYYSYTPSQAGDYNITLSWTRSDGTGAPIYPQGEVDGAVLGWHAATGDPRYDMDVEELYSGTNPETATWTDLDATHTVYFGVMPWIGDCPYHLVVTFKPSGGAATTIIDQGGTAYGADGNVYIPDTGTWHSSRQYWPGGLAAWLDYGMAGGPFDTIPEPSGPIWAPPAPAVDTAITVNDAQQWYTVAPQIWPATRSLAMGSAPLWYTYSFPDATSATAPGYMWGTVLTSAASRLDFCGDTSSATAISFRFYGDSLTWVYEKGPHAGIAKVLIDGQPPATDRLVDQYSPTVVYQATTTWSGLGADQYHTVTVAPSKTKNAASTGLFVYHDAFEAKTNPDDVSPRSEDNLDGSTTYAWNKTAYGPASGGSFSSAKSPSAATAFTFTGTSVTWKYVKAPKAGICRVMIDSVAQPNVDQYAASVTPASTDFTGLFSGVHTIFITGTNTRNAASQGLFIFSDGFVVGGVTYQD